MAVAQAALPSSLGSPCCQWDALNKTATAPARPLPAVWPASVWMPAGMPVGGAGASAAVGRVPC